MHPIVRGQPDIARRLDCDVICDKIERTMNKDNRTMASAFVKWDSMRALAARSGGIRPGLCARAQSCSGTGAAQGREQGVNRAHNRPMPALFRSKNSAVLPAFLGDNRGENFFATGGPSAKDTSPVSRAFGDIEEGVRLAHSGQRKMGFDNRREQAK
jgi:hypothetical protein